MWLRSTIRWRLEFPYDLGQFDRGLAPRYLGSRLMALGAWALALGLGFALWLLELGLLFGLGAWA